MSQMSANVVRGFSSDFWTKLSAAAGRAPRVATKVDHLRDGEKAFQARLDLIANAKTSIACTLYQLETDEYGLRFIDALIAASKRGVFVALSVDFLSEAATLMTAKGKDSKALEAKLEELARSGSFVSWFATPRDHLKKVGQGNHFKSLVVDGTTAIVGGRNMGKSYFHHWTDFDVKLEGPIVQEIGDAALKVLQRSNANNRFDKMGLSEVQRKAYEITLEIIKESLDKAAAKQEADAATRLASGATLPRFQLVFHDPTQAAAGANNVVTDALIDTYRAAEKQMLATSNYVNPVPELRAAAVEASKRGVDTLFATTSAEASRTSSLPTLNAAPALRSFVEAGARVMETNRQEHGKLYVADARVAAFGSYNLEHPAHDRLVEGLLFTDDPATVAAIHDAIMDTVDNRSRPFVAKAPELPFFRALAYGVRRAAARLIEPIA